MFADLGLALRACITLREPKTFLGITFLLAIGGGKYA